VGLRLHFAVSNEIGKMMKKYLVSIRIITSSKIEAIKALREGTNAGLKDCKDFVDTSGDGTFSFSRRAVLLTEAQLGRLFAYSFMHDNCVEFVTIEIYQPPPVVDFTAMELPST